MNHYVDTQEIATSVGMVERQDKEVLLMGIYVEDSAADDILVRYRYDAQIVEFFILNPGTGITGKIETFSPMN